MLIEKKKFKNLKFAQWFLDPLSKKGPDYIKNKLRIFDKILSNGCYIYNYRS